MRVKRQGNHSPLANAEFDYFADQINRLSGNAGGVLNVTVTGGSTGGGTVILPGGDDTGSTTDPSTCEIVNTSGDVIDPGTLIGWTSAGVLSVAGTGVRASLLALALATPGATFSAAFGGARMFRPEPGTTGWAAGKPLWRSIAAAGCVTNVRPTAAGQAQLLGQCRGTVDPMTGLVPGIFIPSLAGTS